jgi:hypothetical protein
MGLSILDPLANKFTNFPYSPKDTSGITTGFVTAVFEENPSTIWAGTMNGLNRIDLNTRKITKFFEKNGLPNNSIRGIIKDNSGLMWVSTNKGIVRFDPLKVSQKSTFKIFSKLDGIQGNEYVIKSCYKTRSGRLLFGGVNGFDFFDPAQVVDNSYVPPIVITDFQLFGKSVKPGTEDSPLEKNISETEEIVLSYKQSVFSFQFTALSYRASDKNQYKYKLEGFDDDWVDAGTNRSVTYTNLDPGEYTFMVKGSNNDGVWNEKGTAIKIIITPPFWATWWFRAIVILLIAWFIRYMYIRAINKRKSLEEINSKLETEIRHSKEAEMEKFRLPARWCGPWKPGEAVEARSG